MQYKLRQQVIEPRRRTFQNLVDRYGDRPASRYEEGTGVCCIRRVIVS